MTLIDASGPDLVMVLIFSAALGVFMVILGLVGRWRGWFE